MINIEPYKGNQMNKIKSKLNIFTVVFTFLLLVTFVFNMVIFQHINVILRLVVWLLYIFNFISIVVSFIYYKKYKSKVNLYVLLMSITLLIISITSLIIILVKLAEVMSNI